jgi:hypothetical protein
MFSLPFLSGMQPSLVIHIFFPSAFQLGEIFEVRTPSCEVCAAYGGCGAFSEGSHVATWLFL